MWDLAAGRMLGEPAQARAVSKSEQVWDELQRFSFGTPDLSLLPDGSVFLAYWATVNQIIHVRGCRFRVHADRV